MIFFSSLVTLTFSKFLEVRKEEVHMKSAPIEATNVLHCFALSFSTGKLFLMKMCNSIGKEAKFCKKICKHEANALLQNNQIAI